MISSEEYRNCTFISSKLDHLGIINSSSNENYYYEGKYSKSLILNKYIENNRKKRMNSNTNEKYWAEYDGLQHAKHQILRRYLGGWFPILASWHGRVLYIDCHAGRGRHDTGQEGSPILALRLLLEHRSRNRILANTEVSFIFFEINEANCIHLNQEIDSIGQLPDGIEVSLSRGDYEERIYEIVRDLHEQGKRLAPTFAFVDPYGFCLSMELLNSLLEFPRCELLINFMYRYIDMAIHNLAQTDNMDILFGCPDWRRLVLIKDSTQRAEATISLFSDQLMAEYVTHIYMRDTKGFLKYVLFHATNHSRGREVMKDAMWSVTPDGSFTAFERHTPNQMVLIVPDPDLEPLKERLWTNFAGKDVYMNRLDEWLVSELYLPKHLHQILRDYRNQEVISFSNYEGRFGFKKNPLVSFPKERPIDN